MNSWTDVEHCNGATGVVLDFIYPGNQKPPDLPIAVIVQFHDYTALSVNNPGSSIHRKKKDGGCTFYLNTLRTKLSPLRYMERYGLMAVVPTLTALLLSSLNDWQFFFVF